MYEREWDALAPLVSPNCLEAMQETMEHMGSVAQRVQLEEGNIVVRSNVLRKVVALQPGDGVPHGSCQLDVHFNADESFRIFVRGHDRTHASHRQRALTWRGAVRRRTTIPTSSCRRLMGAHGRRRARGDSRAWLCHLTGRQASRLIGSCTPSCERCGAMRSAKYCEAHWPLSSTCHGGGAVLHSMLAVFAACLPTFPPNFASHKRAGESGRVGLACGHAALEVC